MKTMINVALLSFLLVSCAQMKQAQLKHVCTEHAAYNSGKANAALHEAKNYYKLSECSDIEKLKTSYDQGYDYYMAYEKNTLGHINGKAGFGANIRFVCAGTLFDQAYIGKGQRESIARQHLRFNCNASDYSVHCSNMYVRCRRVNFSEQI